ncbi:hypothetical protein Amet_2105 [Alkaliphilus metalliredigens QYMF]|uniref:Uncharacterized protein n=1 Tax=Alkaliphilus metalliredigens (strain QYMF) TaxID=293826 RepID=A6TPZ7_ALKMQ|nr:hypothetical protein [Alkaliphilus metalliredigens]ABR48265.1 hypothetical protein Amet_2105 [Alkaliphilus metalliredigens QYMF]
MIRKNDSRIISISAILKEGLNFYKVHFKHLIMLSSLYFITDNLNFFWGVAKPLFYNLELESVHSILMVPVILLSLYMSIRVTVGIYTSIEGRLNDKQHSVREAINKGNERFWAFVGTSILLGLIYFMIFMIPVFILIFAENIAIKVICNIIIYISALYLMVHYQFGVFHSVLDQSSGSQALNFSKNLVEGYKIPVVKLSIVTTIPFLMFFANRLPGYVGGQFPINDEALLWFTRGIIIFISPYISIVTILAYHKLRGLKEI